MGAHALKSTLESRKKTVMWNTASSYQLLHAVAILSLAAICQQRGPNDNKGKDSGDNGNGKILLAGKLMAVGTTMFSGSIYCLSLNIGPKAILGPVTPLGGLLMIGGWVVAGL